MSGTKAVPEEIFFSEKSRTGFSYSTTCFLLSVMKNGEIYPRSNFMPSTTSSWSSNDLPSCTEITPSLPTLEKPSAMSPPSDLSPLAEMVATLRIASVPCTGSAMLRMCETTTFTALSMPRLMSIGFMPAATLLQPSMKMARASTVAVVVPSPATSFVLDATCRTSCAPRFSYLSANSMFFATVTPSLVILGGPYDVSIATLRPLGPSVTSTASAILFTPTRMAERASAPKRMSLPCEKALYWLNVCILLNERMVIDLCAILLSILDRSAVTNGWS